MSEEEARYYGAVYDAVYEFTGEFPEYDLIIDIIHAILPIANRGIE